MKARCEVRYLGQVQGVGFRATALYAARGFEVTGFVRNVQDGSVELVAEGERGEVEGLLQEINERMSGRIRNQTVHWMTARGEFSDFRVEH